jgi:hypothetical protein
MLREQEKPRRVSVLWGLQSVETQIQPQINAAKIPLRRGTELDSIGETSS